MWKTWTPERHGSFKIREKIAQIRSLSGQPQNHNNIFWHHKLPPLSTSRLGCCLPLMFSQLSPTMVEFFESQPRFGRQKRVTKIWPKKSAPVCSSASWHQSEHSMPHPPTVVAGHLRWLVEFFGGMRPEGWQVPGDGLNLQESLKRKLILKGGWCVCFLWGWQSFGVIKIKKLEFGRKLTGVLAGKQTCFGWFRLLFKNDMNPEMITSTRVCRVLKSCGWTLRYWASTPVVGPFHLAGGAIRVPWVSQIVQELMPLLSTKFSKSESGPVPAINGSDPMRLVTTASLKLAAPSMWCATCQWGWALQIQSRIKQPNLTKPTSPCIIRGALVDRSNMRSCPFLIRFTFVEKPPGVRTGGFWISRLDHNWCDNGCAYPPIPLTHQPINQWSSLRHLIWCLVLQVVQTHLLDAR